MGLDRTRSVSGTFFRRTQRKLCSWLAHKLTMICVPGKASQAGSKKFQEAQALLLSMRGKLTVNTSNDGSTNFGNETDASRRTRSNISHLIKTFL